MKVVALVVFFPSMVSSLKSLLSAAIWTNTPGDMFDGMITPQFNSDLASVSLARAVSTISVCSYEQQCPIRLSRVMSCFDLVRCLIVIPNDTCFGSLTLELLGAYTTSWHIISIFLSCETFEHVRLGSAAYSSEDTMYLTSQYRLSGISARAFCMCKSLSDRGSILIPSHWLKSFLMTAALYMILIDSFCSSFMKSF